jgi:predicted Zn finger-like uncharacterized protein
VFTQCPECGSVFRVTADALKVAAGLVRCGVCQHRFNALAALTDDPGAPIGEERAVTGDDETPGADDGPPPFDDTITVEELGAGEVIELGAPSDDEVEVEIDTGGGVAQPDSPNDGVTGLSAAGTGDGERRDLAAEWLPESGTPLAGDDTARAAADATVDSPGAIEVEDASSSGLEAIVLGGDERPLREPVDDVAAGASLDATDSDAWASPAADAATPDAEAIEALLPELAAVRELPGLADDTALDAAQDSLRPLGAATGQDALPAETESRPDLDRTDEFPILVLDERDDAQEDLVDPDEEQQEYEEGPRPTPSAATAAAIGAVAATAIAERARRGGATVDGKDLRFGLEDDAPRWWERRAAWLAGSVLLVLALLAQAVHYNREALARSATFGPWVLRIYTLIGVPAPVPTDLGAMELRQWGAATDARATGRLRLRASVLNRAPFAQPYPVLRVTLHDRFGNALGSRDIGARDYLPGGLPQRRLLATGQRLDAEILLVDPGVDAVGYEIELCEERRDGVRCPGTPRSPS